MWPHVSWPCSCPPTAPHPCPFPLHPQLLLALSMDPVKMEGLMERVMEKMTDKVVRTCVCVFACLLTAFSAAVFRLHFNRALLLLVEFERWRSFNIRNLNQK